MQGLCRLSTNGNLLVLFCLKTYIHISFCPKLSPTIICYTFEPFLFIFCCCFFFFFFTVFKSACYNETVVWSALLGLGKMREKSVVNQLQFAKDQQLQLNRGMNYTLQSLQIIWYILVLKMNWTSLTNHLTVGSVNWQSSCTFDPFRFLQLIPATSYTKSFFFHL